MRLIILFLIACTGLIGTAQTSKVVYLESVGTGGTRVFAVTTPVKEQEVVTVDGKAKLKPEEQACRDMLYAILYDGVENYNQGMPLVTDVNNSFAKSLVNPKNKTFMSYCKEVTLENSPTNKQAYHYIVELNHFNLLRLLKMRGARQEPYME